MKKTVRRLALPTLAISALLTVAACTPSDTGDGTTTGFYGPSSANTPDYTDQVRNEFKTWR